MQSKPIRGENKFRSLTRLVLPIAFGEWCEERLAPGRKRARDLTQLTFHKRPRPLWPFEET